MSSGSRDWDKRQDLCVDRSLGSRPWRELYSIPAINARIVSQGHKHDQGRGWLKGYRQTVII